jgi:hypothetical protein
VIGSGHRIVCGWSNEGEMDRACGTHGTEENCIHVSDGMRLLARSSD